MNIFLCRHLFPFLLGIDLEGNFLDCFPSPGNFRLSFKVAAAFFPLWPAGVGFLISLYPHQHFLSAWWPYCASLCGCAVLSPGGAEVHFHGVCRSITSLVQLYRGGKWGTENLTNSHTNTWCSHLHVNTVCKRKYEYVCMCVYECLSAPSVSSEVKRLWWIP